MSSDLASPTICKEKNMCSNEHSSYKSVLPSQKIRKLLLNQQIISDTKFENEQVQPSSMDLRLGPKHGVCGPHSPG